jgi:hypothetical protein
MNVARPEADHSLHVYERFLDHLPRLAAKLGLIECLNRDAEGDLVTPDDARQAVAIARLSWDHRLAVLGSRVQRAADALTSGTGRGLVLKPVLK